MTAAKPKAVAVVVYGLFDPSDDRLRYIGQSTDGGRRFADHCEASLDDGNPRKRAWIKALEKRNLQPVYRVLRHCGDQDEADRAELDLIAESRARGLADLNRADGGKTNRHVSKLATSPLSIWEEVARSWRIARAELVHAQALMGANGFPVAAQEAARKALYFLDSSRLDLSDLLTSAYPDVEAAPTLFYADGDEFGR